MQESQASSPTDALIGIGESANRPREERRVQDD